MRAWQYCSKLLFYNTALNNAVLARMSSRPVHDGAKVCAALVSSGGRVLLTKSMPQRVLTCRAALSYVSATG